MEITVNNQLYTVTEESSVHDLLSVLFLQLQSGLAVAVNQTVIAKAEWETYKLTPGDKVILIKATQGG